MSGMPGIEFLEEPEDPAGEPEPRHAAPRTPRDLRTRLITVGAALIAAAVALVVVLRSGDSSHPAAAPPSSTSHSASSSASSPRPDPTTLALPATDAFGPHTVDLRTVGNLVFALAPTVVGVANRAGGQQSVRPAPFGLTAKGVHGVLRYDDPNRVLWVVAQGGRAVGAYEPSHLGSLGDFELPGPIRDAVAMDGRLWIITDTGLYVADPHGAVLVPGARHSFTSIAADPARHSVLTVGGGNGDQLYRWNARGLVYHKGVPLLHTTVTVTAGRIWICAFHRERSTGLARLDPATFRILHVSPLTFRLGPDGQVAGTYSHRVLLRGGAGGHELYCIDADTGNDLLQQWTVPDQAVALNERGLLVVSPRVGIESVGADACLTG
jgi:hypothetical protein